MLIENNYITLTVATLLISSRKKNLSVSKVSSFLSMNEKTILQRYKARLTKNIPSVIEYQTSKFLSNAREKGFSRENETE